MKTNYVKVSKIIPILALGLMFSSLVLANEDQPQKDPDKVNISAKTISRNASNNSLVADGDVIVTYKGSIFTADHAEFFDDDRKVHAKGNVFVRDTTSVIKGDSLDYSFETETGVMLDGKAYTHPWVCFGKKMNRVSKEKTVIRKGKFTSCDYEKPHYVFKASKIIIYFNKRLVAFNVLLFIRGIPVFYFPIIYESLRDPKPEVSLVIGYNDTDGHYEKFSFMYPFNYNNKLTLYIDDYGFRGQGFGLKYDYKDPGGFDGSIYGYRIEDRLDDKIKQTLRINHMHNVTPKLKTFIKINYQNDEAFDQDFTHIGDPTILGEEDATVNSNIYSYCTLNYIQNMYSMLAVWEEEENWDDDENEYIKTKEVLPSFTFATNKNRLFKTDFYYKYVFNVKNTYNPDNEVYYVTGNTSFNLTRSIKASRSITLTPEFTVDEVLENSLNEESKYEDNLLTKGYAGLNMRKRIGRNIDLDLTYRYDISLFQRKNEIYTNSLAAALNTYFLRGKLKLNSSSSYDYNMITDNSLERIGPIVSEVRYIPNKTVSFFGKHTYDVSMAWTTIIQGITTIRPFNKLSFTENLSFVAASGDIIDSISTIRYSPNMKWRFETSLRLDYDYAIKEFSGYKEKEFAIYRDLHCWEVKLSWHDKLQTDDTRFKEVWVTFNLKALPQQEISLYKDNIYDREWYEWDVKSRN